MTTGNPKTSPGFSDDASASDEISLSFDAKIQVVQSLGFDRDKIDFILDLAENGGFHRIGSAQGFTSQLTDKIYGDAKKDHFKEYNEIDRLVEAMASVELIFVPPVIRGENADETARKIAEFDQTHALEYQKYRTSEGQICGFSAWIENETGEKDSPEGILRAQAMAYYAIINLIQTRLDDAEKRAAGKSDAELIELVKLAEDETAQESADRDAAIRRAETAEAELAKLKSQGILEKDAEIADLKAQITQMEITHQKEVADAKQEVADADKTRIAEERHRANGLQVKLNQTEKSHREELSEAESRARRESVAAAEEAREEGKTSARLQIGELIRLIVGGLGYDEVYKIISCLNQTNNDEDQEMMDILYSNAENISLLKYQQDQLRDGRADRYVASLNKQVEGKPKFSIRRSPTKEEVQDEIDRIQKNIDELQQKMREIVETLILKYSQFIETPQDYRQIEARISGGDKKMSIGYF